MAARPLNGDEIRSLFADLTARLPSNGSHHVVVIVGGSLLAWHGLRDSTEDVDSTRHIDPELQAAVEEVAADRDLDPDWLNARAAMFVPATFELDACDVLLEHPRLLVLGASLRDVFVMKLYRAQANDVADLIAIWPHTGFTTAREVVDAFVAAYPHAPDDPHLDTFVVEIASRAGYVLPLS